MFELGGGKGKKKAKTPIRGRERGEKIVWGGMFHHRLWGGREKQATVSKETKREGGRARISPRKKRGTECGVPFKGKRKEKGVLLLGTRRKAAVAKPCEKKKGSPLFFEMEKGVLCKARTQIGKKRGEWMS